MATCVQAIQALDRYYKCNVDHLPDAFSFLPIAVFKMIGKIKPFCHQNFIPSIMFREENNVKHYISLKKNNSENFYRLTMTKVNNLNRC